MDDLLISIIIPVYNSSKYISKCLNSIYSQNYSNIEIIIVDDGSTDDSYKICKDFQKKDNRIKLFKQFNSGPSSARNFALDKCTGNYVTFLDSDDEFCKNCFIECMNIIKKFNIDILKFGFIKQAGKLKKNIKFNLPKNQLIMQQDYNKILQFCLTYDLRNVCGTMIKSSIIKNIRFEENLILAEDSLLFFQTLLASKSFFYLDKCLYRYNTNVNGITHIFNENKSLKKLEDVFYVNKKIESKIKEIDVNISTKNNLNESEIKFSVINCIKQSKYDQYINYSNKIKYNNSIKKYIPLLTLQQLKCLNYNYFEFIIIKIKLYLKNILMIILNTLLRNEV